MLRFLDLFGASRIKFNELSNCLLGTKLIELKCSIVIAIQIATGGFISLLAKKPRHQLYHWKQQSTNLFPVTNARLKDSYSGSSKLGKTKHVGAGEPYSLCKPPWNTSPHGRRKRRGWGRGLKSATGKRALYTSLFFSPQFPSPPSAPALISLLLSTAATQTGRAQIVRKSGRTRPQLSHISFWAKMPNTFMLISPFLGNIQSLSHWFAVTVL